MTATNEQSVNRAARRGKGTEKVRVKFFNGNLACIRGDVTWHVSDLNESRKVVPCPACGASNDIQEAKRRAQ